MEFAAEGGEGPTPYEVLLQAAMNGDSTRFTRQDGVEETWRMMQPLLDDPPPVETYRRARGARRRRRSRRRVRRVADALAPELSAGERPGRSPNRSTSRSA